MRCSTLLMFHALFHLIVPYYSTNLAYVLSTASHLAAKTLELRVRRQGASPAEEHLPPTYKQEMAQWILTGSWVWGSGFRGSRGLYEDVLGSWLILKILHDLEYLTPWNGGTVL